MQSSQAHDAQFQQTAGHALRLMERPPGQHRQSQRIAIRNQGRVLLINPSDVLAVVAQGNYVLLQRKSGSYCLRESLAEVAEKARALWGWAHSQVDAGQQVLGRGDRSASHRNAGRAFEERESVHGLADLQAKSEVPGGALARQRHTAWWMRDEARSLGVAVGFK